MFELIEKMIALLTRIILEVFGFVPRVYHYVLSMITGETYGYVLIDYALMGAMLMIACFSMIFIAMILIAIIEDIKKHKNSSKN